MTHHAPFGLSFRRSLLVLNVLVTGELQPAIPGPERGALAVASESEAPPSPLKAAMATLLALGAVYADSSVKHFEGYSLTPDTAVLTFEAAARALADRPKPLSCMARLDNHILEVQCRSLQPHAARPEERYDRISTRAQLLNAIARLVGKRQDDPAVLVRGRGKGILMTAKEIERWLGDYDLEPSGLGFGLDDPDAEASAMGAKAILILVGPVRPTYYKSR
ncbi:MAG TPA: hypothetical protein VJV22_16470 [Acidobacteriaceae bacterium]|nr:hypothetical protein [Acidobacteriaceae bacterium]